MIPSKTHEVRSPSPEHQSIFTNTYLGVPNPQIPHVHPYPTRFHGPVYGVPRFGLPYRQQSWQALSGLPGKSPSGGCISCSGFGEEFSVEGTVTLEGGKTTSKGSLAQAVIEIIEKRSGVKVSADVQSYLTVQLMFERGTTGMLAVLAAYGFEQKKDWFKAGVAWSNAKGWLNVSFNSSTAMQKNARVKAAAKIVSDLFERFAKQDFSGGRQVTPRITFQKASVNVANLISLNPVEPPAPPRGESITIEPSMTPWLILGGVVVAGTAGYFVWKKSKSP